MTREEFVKKEIEKQREIEKSKVFKKYSVSVMENSYPFIDPFLTDNFIEAVNFAKKTIIQQRNYRDSSETLWATIDRFRPIEERPNVRYPYYEIARFDEKDFKTSKYEFGGDFQAGVYAKGGGLDSHGIKQGDTFLKTLSGGIQKVKDKNGNIFYINLATGERSATIPLPFDDGGEVKYFLNKDGIKVRSVAKPEKKLSEAEWMAKHNESKEARGYAFGGLFGKAKESITPKKYPKLDEKQVRLNSGEYVMVLDQSGDTLMVMELSKLGTGAKPQTIKISDVDATSYANGGGVGLIGNQKRIDMNHNGRIDAEDFKLLRSSMNGAWRKEHKYVNSTSRKDGKVIDYEVRYARKNNSSRKGYKGKTFATGGGVNEDVEITSRIQNLIDKIKKEGVYEKGKESTNINGVNYRYDYYKLENPNYNLVKEFDSLQFQNYGQFHFSNTFNQSRLDFDKKSLIIDRPSYKGQKPKFLTFQELVILGKRKMATGGSLSSGSINALGDLWFAVQQKDTDDYKMLSQNLDKLNVPFAIQNEVSADAETQRGRKALNIPEVHDRIKKIVEKNNRKFATGGGFQRLSNQVARNYEGKRVKPQYQKEYGKVYSKEEAKEVGNKVAGKIKANQKMNTGGATKKGGQGGIMVLAKKIRKEGESWQDALKRAGQQLK